MLTKFILIALTTAFANTLAAPTNASVPGPIVTLNSTKYLGLHNDSLHINSYLGIPFAAAPVGALRFQPPQPYISPNSDAPVDVSQVGPQCVQGNPYWTGFNGSVAGSEDCLVLHVHAPDTATPDSKLPVLVIIHGGGYTLGYASVTPPYALMQHTNNAFVFVAIQYRLGAYGFLGGPKYAKEGGAPNVGFLDQRYALEWVQNNIAAFGGDPEKVTIEGGSAGGGSVTAMLAWKGGDVAQLEEKPLFRAAMADYPWWQQYLRAEQLDAQYEVLLDATGCEDLECLKNYDEEKLKTATQSTYATAYQKGMYGFGNFYYGPYVDGEFLRDLPSREFQKGNVVKVPTWVSRDGYEGVSFTSTALTTVAEEITDLKTQFPYANQSFIDKIYELYPSEDFNSTFFHRAQWFGDFAIDCPTRQVAASVTQSNTTVYKQVFNAGAQTHASMSYFQFFFSSQITPGENVTLENAVKDWVASFVIHLDPNTERWTNTSRPVWPEYNQGGEVISLNYTQMGAVSDLWYDNTERCEFFAENGEIVQN